MQPGDEFVASTKLYGGSINRSTTPSRISAGRSKWADPDDLNAVKAAVGEKTKAIFIESIADPGGVVADMRWRRQGGQDPADRRQHAGDALSHPPDRPRRRHHRPLGDQILGGHGHAMGGVIVDGGAFEWRGDPRYPMLSAPRPEYNGVALAESFGNFAFAMGCRALGLRDLGPAISPFNSFLILTGIETLSLRMQRHCDNALAVARHLAGHAKVGWVSYAGLPGDRCHELARRYCPKGAGGVFTFGVKGGYAAGVALVEKLQVVLPRRRHRRRPLAGHPPRLDHPPPARRRAEDRRRRRAGRSAAVDRPGGRRGLDRGPGSGAGVRREREGSVLSFCLPIPEIGRAAKGG